MSLLDGHNDIKIKLYYKYIKVDGSEKFAIVDAKKAEEILKDEEKAKEIETLETGWRMLTWKEQNEVSDISSRSINQQTGEKQFNYIVYRDSIIKRCLKSWNLTMNEKPVPVSPDAIDMLPGSIILNLFEKFEKLIDYSEEELGN
jgi:hypothetical protein